MNDDTPAFASNDEHPHEGLIDEWVFATWTPDGSFGVLSGHRLLPTHSWYWAAVVERAQPLHHLTEWQVLIREADPFIIKAPEMWAEHQLDAPMEQWSLGNEAYFVALDDPDAALGRAYGDPTPLACDLEWYATAPATPIADGYEQVGVVHGTIERLYLPNVELVEMPAHRWRRWGTELEPLSLPGANLPEEPLRAPFRFPGDMVVNWHLTADGWRS